MPAAKQKVTFGSVLRRRRHQLGQTQAQVAKKVGCRPNYIGYLESGARRPSQKLVFKLAKALDLDSQELFLLANPDVRDVVAPQARPADVNKAFFLNTGMHTRYGITAGEIKALKAVAKLGPLRTERDFLFILQAIRMSMQDD